MPLASSGQLSFYSTGSDASREIIQYLLNNGLWANPITGYGQVIALGAAKIRHLANQGLSSGSFSTGTISMSDLYSGRFGAATGIPELADTIGLNDSTYGAGDAFTNYSVGCVLDAIGSIDKIELYANSYLWHTTTGSGLTGLGSQTWSSSSNGWAGAGTYSFSAKAYNGSTVYADSGPFYKSLTLVSNTTGPGIAIDGAPYGSGWSDTEYTITATAGPTGSPTVSLTGPWGTATGSGSVSQAYTFPAGSYTISASASGYAGRSVSFDIY